MGAADIAASSDRGCEMLQTREPRQAVPNGPHGHQSPWHYRIHTTLLQRRCGMTLPALWLQAKSLTDRTLESQVSTTVDHIYEAGRMKNVKVSKFKTYETQLRMGLEFRAPYGVQGIKPTSPTRN